MRHAPFALAIAGLARLTIARMQASGSDATTVGFSILEDDDNAEPETDVAPSPVADFEGSPLPQLLPVPGVARTIEAVP